MPNIKRVLLNLLSPVLFLSCSNYPPLETVPYVDLNKYLGKWYEIASIPQSFQKGCNCTIAEYSLSSEGHIIVINTCNRDSVTGRTTKSEGKAFIDEGLGNAKLKVQFFWPFRGKYWIIELAEDYSYAVVGHPNREYLWILSRTPKMDENTYKMLLKRIKQKQFDITKLQVTKQCE